MANVNAYLGPIKNSDRKLPEMLTHVIKHPAPIALGRFRKVLVINTAFV